MKIDTDAVVIGLGIGGQSVARRLRAAGLSVVGVERDLIGGECHNWACVPTKMMVRAGNVLAEANRVPSLAGASVVVPEWTSVAARIRVEATDDWDDADSGRELAGAGIRVLRGHATLAGAHRVHVNDDVITVRRAVVVATGTEPAVPDIEGLAGKPYWTNRDAARLAEVPASVIVLGGGPVGCEFAQILHRFGAAVVLLESSERLLPSEDPESSDFVAKVFAADGIDVRTGAEVKRVGYDDGRFAAVLGDGSAVIAPHLLVASGRRTSLSALGLDSIGVDLDAGTLPVDGHLRVVDGVWAVGDVTGKGPYTHVATYQARIITDDILGRAHPDADYRAVPRCVFIDPEFAAVGLTAAEAAAQGIRLKVGRASIPSSARGFIHHVGNDGFVALYADADRDVLVGAVSAGPTGAETIGLLGLAIRARISLDTLRYMIYAYPTFYRAVEDALTDMDN